MLSVATRLMSEIDRELDVAGMVKEAMEGLVVSELGADIPRVYVAYIEYLVLDCDELPKLEGIPPDHCPDDIALPGVPVSYLVPMAF